jgi:hypothetical protein
LYRKIIIKEYIFPKNLFLCYCECQSVSESPPYMHSPNFIKSELEYLKNKTFNKFIYSLFLCRNGFQFQLQNPKTSALNFQITEFNPNDVVSFTFRHSFTSPPPSHSFFRRRLLRRNTATFLPQNQSTLKLTLIGCSSSSSLCSFHSTS